MLPFAWNIFFYPLTFSLCVSLAVKWVTCKHHINRSCFLSNQLPYVFWLEHLEHLFLKWFLIGMYLLSFLKLVFWVFLLLCSFLLVLVTSLVVWLFSLVLCWGSFFFEFCVCTVGFWICGYHEVQIYWPISTYFELIVI